MMGCDTGAGHIACPAPVTLQALSGFDGAWHHQRISHEKTRDRVPVAGAGLNEWIGYPRAAEQLMDCDQRMVTSSRYHPARFSI